MHMEFTVLSLAPLCWKSNKSVIMVIKSNQLSLQTSGRKWENHNHNILEVVNAKGTATSGTMELAPVADIRETEAEDFGPGNDVRPRGGDEGIDDGFDTVPSPTPPANGGPRRSPFPRSPSPVPDPGRGGYIPVPTGGGGTGKRPLDVNLYATKKTMAQGMMDLALLTANANQLRYVIEAGRFGTLGAKYYISMTLISLSIIMQLVIGIGLIILGRYNVTREGHAQKAESLNNWVVLGVFVITVINVFISSFAIEPMEGVDPVLLRSVMAGTVTERIESH